MTHLVFEVPFINWFMSCITTISFAILISGPTLDFFHAQRGLHQGFPLFPLLFLLVAEGLSRMLVEAKIRCDLKGVVVVDYLTITYLLFMEDILLFCDGSKHDLSTIKGAPSLMKKYTSMEVNIHKYTLSPLAISRDESANAYNFFLFTLTILMKV